ncbi:cupin domain-containing protein [Paenibacillus sp. J5C_2022]|uniref:cupin domain-containing protein n=1 Tax=Paenibacillus sp. J5C2022 TaxID=2977129 RepID=UPI0021D01686|nr:cupin domain-containing protein [Paenibacillus sp. J5C2022]MCU6707508.1 cupin domain-containing protein [Paenibacillus sp. J5C2022]
MLRGSIYELKDGALEHVLEEWLPGKYLSHGGLAFAKPGERSHSHDGPGGRDYHTHKDCEAFVILQGRGLMEVDGGMHAVKPGDIIVIEPGEDHHLISDERDPIVTLWLHAGEHRHRNQLAGGIS